jgi:transposase InsO family protein
VDGNVECHRQRLAFCIQNSRARVPSLHTFPRRPSCRPRRQAQLRSAEHAEESIVTVSDQGSQYTSLAFGKRCKEAGVRPSMGSVGDAYDNAMCESFFATLECELLERRRFCVAGQVSSDRPSKPVR